MGFFSKINGVDARFTKYKQRALNILEIVRSQAEEDDRDFENIMFNKIGDHDSNLCIDQSLKLSIFIASAVAEFEENKELMHIKGWKLLTLSKVVEDVMLENGYHKWNLEWFLLRYPKKLDTKEMLLYLKRISYSHGGRSVAMGINNNDDIYTRLNISIFLDILEEGDGYYADFEAGPVTVDSYKLINNL
jgi:hypothetical protein